MGSTIESLNIAQKKAKEHVDAEDVFHYIEQNPNCTQKDMETLGLRKSNLVKFLLQMTTGGRVKKSGLGVSGKPYTYAVDNTIPMEVHQ